MSINQTVEAEAGKYHRERVSQVEKIAPQRVLKTKKPGTAGTQLPKMRGKVCAKKSS